MPTPRTAEALGLAFHAAQARRARLTANEIQRLWAQLDRRHFTASWNSSVGPRVIRALTAGQLASAAAADEYVDAVAEAEGADPDRAGRVRPEGFAGVAADGRALESLMYLPLITSKTRIAAGQSVDDALMAGLRQALRIGSSEVTQAGRGAVGTSMTGARTIQGYVRVVQPPACSRCVILAGKEYGWNKGFQRHPKCDCIHLPTTLIARGSTRRGASGRGFLDPHAYFGSLSRAEQDRVFTAAGARAIREGGDINAIVNARRGMYTTTSGLRATREGTSRRGEFYRAERRRDVAAGRVRADIGRRYSLTTARLLPEEIFELAGSRDQAIAMLRRFGYMG
ncbi:VG15 protein [Streptomyces sp. 900116325]